MNREQIINIIKDLAKAQGSYYRLLDNLLALKEEDEDSFNTYMEVLENKNFKDAVDLVMYFEG